MIVLTNFELIGKVPLLTLKQVKCKLAPQEATGEPRELESPQPQTLVFRNLCPVPILSCTAQKTLPVTDLQQLSWPTEVTARWQLEI